MVSLIITPEQLQQAFAIRWQVFVEEQHVPAEEELDDFEPTSRHFLAFEPGGTPVATARWRTTDLGIKLERFAVLGPYRGQGYGLKILQAVLADIAADPAAEGKVRYLHAQLSAAAFYAAAGFTPTGPVFEEAGIQHVKMVL